jgi:hypothetical protein
LGAETQVFDLQVHDYDVVVVELQKIDIAMLHAGYFHGAPAGVFQRQMHGQEICSALDLRGSPGLDPSRSVGVSPMPTMAALLCKLICAGYMRIIKTLCKLNFDLKAERPCLTEAWQGSHLDQSLSFFAMSICPLLLVSRSAINHSRPEKRKRFMNR